ncbi:hypothetical protein ED733_007912 [Metarhizium rileyi]|uniref:Uncharacterized protein n=1 Tax=Metarhizium rileyi (strain RCEF 4871) TaxID=1649241 RepID=A0A5C6GH85_METRR|nr:hypothetical protein ED733_007912 [Metarhizium rileyi]
MAAQLSLPAIPGDWDTSTKVGEAAPDPGAETSGLSDPSRTNHNGLSQPAPPNRLSNPRLPRTNASPNVRDKEQKPLSKTPSGTTSVNVGLDPLSTQIYLRTNSNTEPTIAQRLLHSARGDSPTRDSQHRQSIDSQGKTHNAAVDSNRDRKKGSSFLSRLAIRGAWRKDDYMIDSDSELGELRTDGFNARALTSVGAGGGYIPLHKEPPRYIRVKPYNKKSRDFNHLFLAQELSGARGTSEDESRSREPATAVGSKILKAGDAIWATEFSLDGQYLAVAGKDQTVRVFSVISTPEERRAYDEEEEGHGRGNGEKLSAPVFRSKPAREFRGHTGEVLDLSWSKNNFLLSSSMDKTVKLWHMSRPECLCTFKHNDLVTSIAFHPTDDRFFLAGSLDAQLRLWSIPDKAVAFSAAANDFITAAAFSPDGKMAMCGLLSGLCLFFETEGLKLQSQIHVRSSRGKNAKGSKITGIRTALLPTENGKKEVKVLISSNDSRLRIYNMRTKMLEVKFRGLENQSSQIHACFSDDGAYIISGSEDRRAYIWSANNTDNDLKDKQPYECFDAHPEVVTTALMAPIKTRQLLSASGDPIFDLCNPPPVMLLSLEERNASQTKFSEGGQHDGVASARKPEESPAYIKRSRHLEGNIIVTTDRTGTIKVFRQDCAYTKRQQSQWETGSKFSGRLAGGVGRSGSIATRTSTGSRVRSRRGSLNLGPAVQQTQPASDRIMSWRQDVEGRPSIGLVTSRSDRSLSPMKSSQTTLNSSAANLASDARKQPYVPSLANKAKSPTSPTSSIYTERESVRARRDKDNGGMPLTPGFSLINASESEQNEDRGEGSFWNLSRWKPNISGLRYSLNANAPGSGSGSSPGGNSRTGGDGLKAGDRGSGHHSSAIHDTRRLKAEDANRRRSLGPTSASRPRLSESGSAGKYPEVGAEGSNAVMPSKKRTDSGVAEVSADSTDDSDTATCRDCGGRSFKVKRQTKGKTVLSCQKCGALTES